MDKLPQRKSQRLAGYNYSGNGYYFITCCIHNKNTYLGKIVTDSDPDESIIRSPRMQLSKYGDLLDETIHELEERYTNLIIESYCIMPNHVHLLVLIVDDSSKSSVGAIHESPAIKNYESPIGTANITNTVHESPASDVNPRSLLSKAIGYMKMQSAKQIRLANHAIPGVWQRGYHDRIIRNEQELARVRHYIKTNAQRWKYDVFYVKDL